MATLNSTLTLTGTAADFGNAIAISVSDATVLAAGKAVVHKIVTVDHIAAVTNFTNPQIFDAGNMGRCLVYIKNIHGSKEIFLVETAAEAVDGDVFMHLEPGEFAIFPWAAVMDIFATTGADGAGQAESGLEYMIWEI
jgi:hypothetical protein